MNCEHLQLQLVHHFYESVIVHPLQAQQTADSNQENLCHLASLANLVLDEKAANELISIGIERKLGGHLLNRNLKIQEKVSGIFRYLIHEIPLNTKLI